MESWVVLERLKVAMSGTVSGTTPSVQLVESFQMSPGGLGSQVALSAAARRAIARIEKARRRIRAPRDRDRCLPMATLLSANVKCGTVAVAAGRRRSGGWRGRM